MDNIYQVIFIISIIMISIFILIKKNIINLYRCTTCWIISYILFLGITVFSGIEYTTNLSYNAIIYIAIFIGLFGVGEFIGRKMKKGGESEAKLDIKILRILSIVGAILITIDIIRLNGISMGLRYENFNISYIGVIGSFLTPLGLICWLYDLYAYKILGEKINIISFISLLSYLITAFLTAGRQTIMISLVASIMVNISYKKAVKKRIGHKLKIGIYIFSLGLVILSYLIGVSENRAQVDNKYELFVHMFKGQMKYEMLESVYNLGPIGEVVVDGLYYYSHSLRYFSLMYEDYESKPTWGMNQFPYISRRINQFIPTDSLIQSANTTNQILYGNGLSKYGWKTAFHSSIVDFGKIGTLIFSIVLGIGCGKNLRSIEQEKKWFNVIFHALACTGIIFTIQYSPFSETSWAYVLYWLIIIRIIEKSRIRIVLRR